MPDNFDGLGLFTVKNYEGTWGISKTYEFQYKPIQEFLSALYLTRLEKTDIIKEMLENLRNKECEMVWLFYAGLTNLNQVCIEKVVPKHNIALVATTATFYNPPHSVTQRISQSMETMSHLLHGHGN